MASSCGATIAWAADVMSATAAVELTVADRERFEIRKATQGGDASDRGIRSRLSGSGSGDDRVGRAEEHLRTSSALGDRLGQASALPSALRQFRHRRCGPARLAAHAPIGARGGGRCVALSRRQRGSNPGPAGRRSLHRRRFDSARCRFAPSRTSASQILRPFGEPVIAVRDLQHSLFPFWVTRADRDGPGFLCHLRPSLGGGRSAHLRLKSGKRVSGSTNSNDVISARQSRYQPDCGGVDIRIGLSSAVKTVRSMVLTAR